jgi:hypothetical protein
MGGAIVSGAGTATKTSLRQFGVKKNGARFAPRFVLPKLLCSLKTSRTGTPMPCPYDLVR